MDLFGMLAEATGIVLDPAIFIIVLIIAVIVLIVMLRNQSRRITQLTRRIDRFMQDSDSAESFEEDIVQMYSDHKLLTEDIRKNQESIRNNSDKLTFAIRHVGIVKYDAFNHMGGNLSYAVAMLDDHHDGMVMNTVQSVDGCYSYCKIITAGKPDKMLDIKFVRENPEIVKENIRKKFQDEKLPLVDQVIELDAKRRSDIQEVEALKAARNKISKENGPLFGQLKKCGDDEAKKAEIQAKIDANNAIVKEDDEKRDALDAEIAELDGKILDIMYVIPNIIDPSVPIGKDDTFNVEVQRFGEPVVPPFEVPHHVDIMASFDGIDKEAAGKVAGMGFYYLLGDIARLHEAVLAYARDFMIDEKGFTYVIPPFMMHGNVVKGVMSFPEMEAMMYKIEGEDLYLIGTSEHTMIGRFIDQIIPEEKMPLTLTSYSPCFRKEVGSHGLEERGVYRIHQFEKQEMIVICKPEDSMMWYDRLWKNSVELFRNLEIPVRQLECCSGDLADLKVKSCDIEAWSPRQQKYFEVCSCSNLGEAQARRLGIRIKGADGKLYLAHTLNNTCVAPPRMLIAFLENHLQEDGTVTIPKVLQPYMGGKEVLVPNKK